MDPLKAEPTLPGWEVLCKGPTDNSFAASFQREMLMLEKLSPRTEDCIKMRLLAVGLTNSIEDTLEVCKKEYT